jgi:hypothetical protein
MNAQGKGVTKEDMLEVIIAVITQIAILAIVEIVAIAYKKWRNP